MTVGQGVDICISIDQKLDRVVSSDSAAKYCIFRVHDVLRSTNVKAYEPEIVGIGPYHRNKSHLQMMEEHKLRFMKLLLHRKKMDNVIRYAAAMKELEEKARRCYAESTDHLSTDEFVEMMVIDGCFIIELMSKFAVLKSDPNNEKVKNDPLFRMEWILTFLQRDLMLFENQLPFFVLSKLYKMIEPSGRAGEFIRIALEFFNDLFPGYGTKSEIGAPEDNNFEHLLDFTCWSTSKLVPQAELKCNMDTFNLIGSSTELSDAGIKFQKLDNEVSFDIEFNKGLLQIPVLVIEDRTECFLRNLVAYEQYSGSNRSNLVTDYVTFFGCLIKSAEDVKKLSRRGILRSFVGDDDEAVGRMFRSMNNGIVGPSRNFHYAELFVNVNSHCDKRRNRWMAALRRNHMRSPWGFISVLAACTLLLLTLLQIIFQFLSWKHI